VSFQRGIDGSDPVDAEGVGGRMQIIDERRTRTSRLGVGTLACPQCDAPVALAGPLAPSAPLACPYCAHHGPLRDFLSLGAPSRPARVVVRVIAGRRRSVRHAAP
jgi:hypothetical protein